MNVNDILSLALLIFQTYFSAVFTVAVSLVLVLVLLDFFFNRFR